MSCPFKGKMQVDGMDVRLAFQPDNAKPIQMKLKEYALEENDRVELKPTDHIEDTEFCHHGDGRINRSKP